MVRSKTGIMFVFFIVVFVCWVLACDVVCGVLPSFSIILLRKRELVTLHKLGLVATKPVFGVPDKARLNPFSTATGTS